MVAFRMTEMASEVSFLLPRIKRGLKKHQRDAASKHEASVAQLALKARQQWKQNKNTGALRSLDAELKMPC